MGDDAVEPDAAAELARVLAGQARATGALADGAQALRRDLDGDSARLDRLLAQVDALAADLGVSPSASGKPAAAVPSSPPVAPADEAGPPPTWDELLARYADEPATVSLSSLLSPTELAAIDRAFDAPLAREPWDRWDGVVVAAAGLVGIVADWFCAPLGNPLSEHLRSYGTELHDREGVYKHFRAFQARLGDGPLAERFQWVRSFADMKVTHHGLPIDYSGPKFGGQHHRQLSSGHDLLRFFSAIWQIKNGQFVGTRFEDGVAILEVHAANHRGTPYTPRGLGESIVLYLLHVFADFFTKTSLPIPGSTLLRELPSRDIRVFVANAYKGINPWEPEAELRRSGNPLGGYNLRHVVGQAPTVAVTQLVVWLYYLLRYRLPDWADRLRGRPRRRPEAVPGLKLRELIAAAHTFVAAVNVGKVVVANNPLLLNLPQLLACVRAVARVAMRNLRRYDHGARLERNRVLLDDGWESLEAMVGVSVDLSGLPVEGFVLR